MANGESKTSANIFSHCDTTLTLIVKPRVPSSEKNSRSWHLLEVVLITCGLYFTPAAYLAGVYCYYRMVYLVVQFVCQHSHPVIHVTSDKGLIFATLVLVVSTMFLLYRSLPSGTDNEDAYPSTWIRSLKIWDLVCDFFPVHLVLSKELLEYSKRVCGDKCYLTDDRLISNFCGLPNDRNYLVGIHPHGVWNFGAFFNFVTEATGISQVFPNFAIRVAAWPPIVKLPGIRQAAKLLGVISVSKRSLIYALEKSGNRNFGKIVAVVVGGAPEMYEAHPGKYNLYIKQRYGFFKIALQTGSNLIPCISFGELNTYKHIPNHPKSLLRRIQDWYVRMTGVSFPIVHGLGPFLIRAPLNTLLGAPIECEKVESPTTEQVMELKRRYLTDLKRLYDKYKTKFDPNAEEMKFV